MKSKYEIIQQIKNFSSLLDILKVLKVERPYYDWIGIYFLKDKKLSLGPYLGKPTPHTTIALNAGICGAAASLGETIIVDDVNSDARYLACSIETRSEIVVPIVYQSKVLGEIDIDSDKPSAFGIEDKTLLEEVAEWIAPMIAENKVTV